MYFSLTESNQMNYEYLETERLLLRKLTQESFNYIFAHLNDKELIEFLGMDSQEELAIQRAKFNAGLSTHNRKFVHFQLIEKSSQKVIGWCGYHTWYTDHFRAEIGYGMNSDEYKNKGFMSEALLPILEYGFTKMDLHRIEALVAPYNEPSLKLIQKFNFQQEGHLKQHYFVNGKAEDSLFFALLRSEF